MSQEVDTEGYDEVAERRVVHIEELVDQLVRQRNGGAARVPEQELPLLIPDPAPGCSVSTYLYSIFPTSPTAATIQERGISRSMLACLGPGRDQPWDVAEKPSPSSHPIHFARKLIQLALCLQQQKDPSNDAARYVGIVSRLVTSQDMLLDSVDGLETLMLEAIYYMNDGNPRGAWLLFRRALAIAQMIGLDSMKDDQRARIVWFWLIRGDRYFSLNLGLPLALTDNSFADLRRDAREDLENSHAVIAGRIIERNQRMQRNRESEYEETLDIDYSLKMAANCFPSTWWTFRTFDGLAEDEIMEMMARLSVQMHHYCLILTLHQPYLTLELCSFASSTDLAYSKAAIPTASREVLLRFLVLRRFHHGPSYRAIDIKAYKASIALLLAHIDGHRFGRMNVLEHLRPQDLGMIKDVLEVMDDAVGPSEMALNVKQLVAIESEVAKGKGYDWVKGGEVGLQFELPFFGTLRAVPRGLQKSRSETEQDHTLGRDNNLSVDLAVFGQNGSDDIWD